MKTCSKCGADETTVKFRAQSRVCHLCKNKRKRERYASEPGFADKVKQRVRSFAENNPDSARNTYLKKRYGITLIEYNEILESQEWVCAICDGPPSGRGSRHGLFYVDHDHETGNVRALLCHQCNVAIGMLDDDPQLCERAAAYLRKHGE